MYQTLKALVETSIDYHLYGGDDNIYRSIHHPYSRYQVWKRYSEAKDANQITKEQYDELHRYYDKMLAPEEGTAIKKLRNYLTQSALFEVQRDRHLYTCTPSLKGPGMQISYFIYRQGNWVAWCDRQCPTIDDVLQAIKDYGLISEVSQYYITAHH